MLKPSEVLKQVADHIDPRCHWNWNEGLCGNIYRNFGNGAEQLAKYWMRQRVNGKYSGNRVYPVPYDIDALHGRDIAYMLDYDYSTDINLAQIAYHAHDSDLYTGCYGRARREMALYLSIMFAAQGE